MSHLTRFALLAVMVSTMAAAPVGKLYAYTGYEKQPPSRPTAEQTSLYIIDPSSGRTSLVVNYDNGVFAKGGVPHETCVAGQDAHLAYSSSTNTIYGMPRGGADAPMIMHDVKTNISVCDDSIENAWGLTLVSGGSASATDSFVAFQSSYDSSFGQWSFEVGLVQASGAVKPSSTAQWNTAMMWDQSTKSQFNMFACALSSGFAAVDETKGALFIMCGGGEGDLPWMVYTVNAQQTTWKMVHAANLTSGASATIVSVLGFSVKEGGIRCVGYIIGGHYLLGYISPLTGNWVRPPVRVKTQDGSPVPDLSIFAIDASSETVFAFTSSAPAAILNIGMSTGAAKNLVTLSSSLLITNMVFV
eukprot:gene15273-633_t